MTRPSPLTPDSKAHPRLPPPPTSPPGVFFFPPPGCFGFGRSTSGAVAGGSCRQGQPRAGGEPEAAPGLGREDSGRNLRPRPSTGASKSGSPPLKFPPPVSSSILDSGAQPGRGPHVWPYGAPKSGWVRAGFPTSVPRFRVPGSLLNIDGDRWVPAREASRLGD